MGWEGQRKLCTHLLATCPAQGRYTVNVQSVRLSPLGSVAMSFEVNLFSFASPEYPCGLLQVMGSKGQVLPLGEDLGNFHL